MRPYIYRDVENKEEIAHWFKKQLMCSISDDMHVTQIMSRNRINIRHVQFDKGKLIIPSGNRIMKPLGRGEYLGMTIHDKALHDRHHYFKSHGCSHDFPIYRPHISIVNNFNNAIDVSFIEPFHGDIILGPEQYRPIREITEDRLHQVSFHQRIDNLNIRALGASKLEIHKESDIDGIFITMLNGNETNYVHLNERTHTLNVFIGCMNILQDNILTRIHINSRLYEKLSIKTYLSDATEFSIY